MASFTRGLRLLPCPQSPLRLASSISLSSPQRPFTASLRFFAAGPSGSSAAASHPTKAFRPSSPSSQSSSSSSSSSSPPPLSSSAPSKPSPRIASGAPSRYAFVKNLANNSSPTVLYEAPSHFWFYFGCWSSGLSILTWTVLTGPTVVTQPEGIPQWVGWTFAASYAILGSMGFYIISKTPNIVSSIRILPPQATQVLATSTSGAVRAAAAAAAATKTTTTTTTTASPALPKIEVTVKRMLPMLQPKVITTDLDKVLLKTRFSLPSEFVPELKRLERQREQEAARQALRKFDMEHLLTMPFRRIGRAVLNLFRGVRAAWTGMGYGIIRVDGKEYKVDVTKGYAHDGFQTLERIVTVGWK